MEKSEYSKRELGAYYTELFNPFVASNVFQKWIKDNKLSKASVVEPFAGNNSIIKFLHEMGIASDYQSYDIKPSDAGVKKRDSILDYPEGFDLCVTNPPWFYKSSASRRNAYFPETNYDNIYKLCLEKALSHNKFVAMLLPASFTSIKDHNLLDRLDINILINKPLFADTENPVCLALFGDKLNKNPMFYNDDDEIGDYQTLLNYMPRCSSKQKYEIKFNDPKGKLGLRAIDNNKEASIRFCRGEELEDYSIKESSRSITRINGEFDITDDFLRRVNEQINLMREKTADVFLTPFKGLRADGKYRRRMNYFIARDILASLDERHLFA
ncbi:MAG: hypothetical protein HAW61_04075 [Candidatus Portiera sp.]|nr:hypothetical protein [Portiera sp.]